MTKKRQRALPKDQRPASKATPIEAVSAPPAEHNSFWPIPELTRLDLASRNIKHLPAYAIIPDRFKRSVDPYAQFISNWFFDGLKADDMARITPRQGVDRDRALVAIKAILGSFEPQHEHKEAGCAFLLHQWFDLASVQP